MAEAPFEGAFSVPDSSMRERLLHLVASLEGWLGSGELDIYLNLAHAADPGAASQAVSSIASILESKLEQETLRLTAAPPPLAGGVGTGQGKRTLGDKISSGSSNSCSIRPPGGPASPEPAAKRMRTRTPQPSPPHQPARSSPSGTLARLLNTTIGSYLQHPAKAPVHTEALLAAPPGPAPTRPASPAAAMNAAFTATPSDVAPGFRRVATHWPAAEPTDATAYDLPYIMSLSSRWPVRCLAESTASHEAAAALAVDADGPEPAFAAAAGAGAENFRVGPPGNVGKVIAGASNSSSNSGGVGSDEVGTTHPRAQRSGSGNKVAVPEPAPAPLVAAQASALRRTGRRRQSARIIAQQKRRAVEQQWMATSAAAAAAAAAREVDDGAFRAQSPTLEEAQLLLSAAEEVAVRTTAVSCAPSPHDSGDACQDQMELVPLLPLPLPPLQPAVATAEVAAAPEHGDEEVFPSAPVVRTLRCVACNHTASDSEAEPAAAAHPGEPVGLSSPKASALADVLAHILSGPVAVDGDAFGSASASPLAVDCFAGFDCQHNASLDACGEAVGSGGAVVMEASTEADPVAELAEALPIAVLVGVALSCSGGGSSSSNSGGGGGCSSGGGSAAGVTLSPIRGLFDPLRYMRRRECIQLLDHAPPIWVTRSQFEKLCGSSTAKWYRSIRVLGKPNPAGDKLAPMQRDHGRGGSPERGLPPTGTVPETLGDWLERHGLPVWKGPNRPSLAVRYRELSSGGLGSVRSVGGRLAPRAGLGAAAAAAAAALIAADEASRAPAGSSVCASAAASAMAAAAAAAAAVRAATGETGGDVCPGPVLADPSSLPTYGSGTSALAAAMCAAACLASPSAAMTVPVDAAAGHPDGRTEADVSCAISNPVVVEGEAGAEVQVEVMAAAAVVEVDVEASTAPGVWRVDGHGGEAADEGYAAAIPIADHAEEESRIEPPDLACGERAGDMGSSPPPEPQQQPQQPEASVAISREDAQGEKADATEAAAGEEEHPAIDTEAAAEASMDAPQASCSVDMCSTSSSSSKQDDPTGVANGAQLPSPSPSRSSPGTVAAATTGAGRRLARPRTELGAVAEVDDEHITSTAEAAPVAQSECTTAAPPSSSSPKRQSGPDAPYSVCDNAVAAGVEGGDRSGPAVPPGEGIAWRHHLAGCPRKIARHTPYGAHVRDSLPWRPVPGVLANTGHPHIHPHQSGLPPAPTALSVRHPVAIGHGRTEAIVPYYHAPRQSAPRPLLSVLPPRAAVPVSPGLQRLLPAVVRDVRHVLQPRQPRQPTTGTAPIQTESQAHLAAQVRPQLPPQALLHKQPQTQSHTHSPVGPQPQDEPASMLSPSNSSRPASPPEGPMSGAAGDISGADARADADVSAAAGAVQYEQAQALTASPPLPAIAASAAAPPALGGPVRCRSGPRRYYLPYHPYAWTATDDGALVSYTPPPLHLRHRPGRFLRGLPGVTSPAAPQAAPSVGGAVATATAAIAAAATAGTSTPSASTPEPAVTDAVASGPPGASEAGADGSTPRAALGRRQLPVQPLGPCSSPSPRATWFTGPPQDAGYAYGPSGAIVRIRAPVRSYSDAYADPYTAPSV